jgi:tetratricopeptide (TPR) repeat protein
MSDDSDAERQLELALAHHEAGQVDLAEAGYRAILQQNPNEPDALNLLGVIAQDRGNLAESIALISRAVAIEPDFPEALTNLARAQHAAGDPNAAADAARHAVALDPELAEAHLQLGHALIDLGDNLAAASALTKAAALAPQSADAFRQLGVAQLRLKNYEAAVDALQTALRLDPDRVDAMVSLGAALIGLDRRDAALVWHKKATTMAPDNAAGHAALAVTLRRRLDAVGSMAACRRALELAPDRVDIWLLLGSNLAVTGQFEEAEACCRKALSLNPDSVEARRDLAMIDRQSGDATQIGRMRAALDDPAAPRSDRIAAGFGLGALLDRAGEYDAAFAALKIANWLSHEDLVATGQTFDAADLRKYVDWAIDTFPKDGFTATAGSEDASDLPVFIVGMPRSGTSLVEQIAASHPKVFGAGERRDVGEIIEVLNGGKAHRAPIEWDIAAVRRAVVAQIARLRGLGGDATRVIDKMPDNVLVLGFIAILFPGARVIICRRDPRDVCLSCYFKPFADGMVWAFDQMELAERSREIERLMDHWRAVLPLRLIEIQYEDLVADLEGQSRRLINFLDLAWDPACLAFHETERPVMTASYWEVRQGLYTSSAGRWRHYRKHLGPLLLGLANVAPPEIEDDWDAIAADETAALAVAVQHHRIGGLDMAEPIYRALLRRNPDDPTALHLLGLLLMDRGQPELSIALITRSLTLRPDVPTALADLARAQRAAGDPKAAIESARLALVFGPGLADAHVQLGCALVSEQNYAEAIEVLRYATMHAPRSFEAHVNLAVSLVQQKDFDAAAEAWEAALEIKPDEPTLLVDYAGTLVELERYGEALALYRRAVVLAPNHPGARYGMAWTLMRTGDAVAAAEVCRDALAITPDRSELWWMLGGSYATCGRFEDAAEAYRRTLELDPSSIDAMNGLAAIGMRGEAHGPSDALDVALHDESREISERISAGFALGRERDKQGAYDAAFEAYSIANRLFRERRTAEGHVFTGTDLRGLVDWLTAAIGPETFAETAGWGDPSELPVFVVGMPRSGTTLVEQIAASHPRVFGAGELKDVARILTALSGEYTAGLPTGWDRAAVRRETISHMEYLRGLGGDAIRVIDKLPDNLFSLAQIAVLFPRARVVVCRRDLRDVGLSCFFQSFSDNALMWTDDLADCGIRARETERLMEHWRKVLPLRILEVQYESLVGNLEAESRRLIDFLGLEWDPACLSFHETERTVLTASHWQVRQPLYDSSVGRWRHYQKHLGPLLKELAPVLPTEFPSLPG